MVLTEMNLGDPDLELLDPTPNIHSLFMHFDQLFFWTKLATRVVVRWSKRMYSCAGVCSYEGKNGLCDIALSEPLLKLRPRKNLIETLLHEMIHAYLFVTSRDLDRDGHGPNFKAHMHRINKLAGLNITIYHDFHEEVKLYQTHWWRCNGPCQTLKPYFGIVRRSSNRAPGPSDYWWNEHQRKCRGKFIKIKEPEKVGKKKNTAKPNTDITKYIINNNNNKIVNNNVPQINKPKSILQDSENVMKSNSPSKIVKIDSVFSPKVNKPPLFTGSGHTISGKRNRTNSVDAAATVRNIWANKQLTPTNGIKTMNSNTKPKVADANPNKHKAEISHTDSPPTKMKKINDYFKNTASSILKDVYGQDFKITQSNNSNKLKAETVQVDLVHCPICNNKIKSGEINRHLDECLNKDLIGILSGDKAIEIDAHRPESSQTNDDKTKLKELVGKLSPIPVYKGKSQINVHVNSIVKTEGSDSIDLTKDNIASLMTNNDTKATIIGKTACKTNLRRSDNFIIPKQEKTEKHRSLDSVKIKSEPGSSKEMVSDFEKVCPCCGKKVDKQIEEHLDECLVFFDNNTTVPEEGASTSFSNTTIIDDDDDDLFDETLIFNATGTKSPCPCCLKMVEQAEMNDHLNECLGF